MMNEATFPAELTFDVSRGIRTGMNRGILRGYTAESGACGAVA